MSTSQGTTATGVQTHGTEVTTDPKAPKATPVVDSTPDYKKLDRAVTSAFKSAEGALERVATAIVAAHEAEVHRFTVNEATGKPFASFAAYAKDRAAGFPILSKAMSKQLMVTLHEAGVSLRAIAALTNVNSQATVKNVIDAATGSGEGGEGSTVDTGEAAKALAAKLAKAAPGYFTRVSDALPDMTDEDLAAIVLATRELASVAEATARNRVEASDSAAKAARAKAAKREAAKRDAEAAKAHAPSTVAEAVGLVTPRKVTPATVAAKRTPEAATA